MKERFSRTALLLGEENMKRLYGAKVAVFGLGGVGGHCVEALARSGIGTLGIFDGDTVCVTNINRQIIATTKTIGRHKADVCRERILEINPEAKVHAHRMFYLPETAETVDLSEFDYIIDAVDTMAAKIELACRASACGKPIISSMGAANKLDPTAFAIADIYETSVCPMARIMRRELRKRGIGKLKVVYSKELPVKPAGKMPESFSYENAGRKQIPASNAFVPPAAGLIMAGEVIKDLLEL